MQPEATSSASVSSQNESVPLLGERVVPRRKPFYRARPLWLVPFAVMASLTRGMTLAPRVEVFTQLSCNKVRSEQASYNRTHHPSSIIVFPQSNAWLHHTTTLDPLGPHLHRPILLSGLADNDDDTQDPRQIPSSRCIEDPAVQAGAARLQMIMTTTMGLLTALTTGWWGHFGERHGRTTVLAIATFGLFLTDLIFILVSTPSSPLSHHGHKLLLLAPFIEGLLGGWSTLQSATSAYLSDCTSSGSRAHIFSRFAGVFYIGFSLGPSIGAWLIQHPIPILASPGTEGRAAKTVTSVFWVAIACSFINFVLVLLVFPESLDKEKKDKAMREYVARTRGTSRGKARASEEGIRDERDDVHERPAQTGSVISKLLEPLAVFLPVVVMDPTSPGRKRRDWSLTLLAASLIGYMLSTGVYQIKYLYAEHVYGWGTEQLSHYISFLGGARAMYLLLLLPTIISLFKPKPVAKKGNAKAAQGKKPKPTRAQLGREIAFDLTLTRWSLVIDIVANALITLAPAPSYHVHDAFRHHKGFSFTMPQMSNAQSQALFVLASSMNSLGSGSIPAVHSLALCLMQVRALDTGTAAVEAEEVVVDSETAVGTGSLFGAFAVLQSVGQMILGPMLFGLVYSNTVARFPKAIFFVAAAILIYALVMVLLVRNPVRPSKKGKRVIWTHSRRRDVQVERGRSRVSKDLRGGGAGYYYSTSEGSPGYYGSVNSSPNCYQG